MLNGVFHKMSILRTFMLTTVGFTFLTFCTGALSWWGPTYVIYGLRVAEQYYGDEARLMEEDG